MSEETESSATESVDAGGKVVFGIMAAVMVSLMVATVVAVLFEVGLL
ncbi:MAG: hypothetical protein SV760_00235 [Halobacteria archaeon]|nr:hypothetical protein [Halobacteria archaeon]